MSVTFPVSQETKTYTFNEETFCFLNLSSTYDEQDATPGLLCHTCPALCTFTILHELHIPQSLNSIYLYSNDAISLVRHLVMIYTKSFRAIGLSKSLDHVSNPSDCRS